MHKILMDLIFAFLTGRHCLQSVVTKLSSVVGLRLEFWSFGTSEKFDKLHFR